MVIAWWEKFQKVSSSALGTQEIEVFVNKFALSLPFILQNLKKPKTSDVKLTIKKEP